MFKYDRSYQTMEQRSLAIKSLDATKNPLTCAQKYSQYASVPSAGNTTGGSSNAYRKITNCTKLQKCIFKWKSLKNIF